MKGRKALLGPLAAWAAIFTATLFAQPSAPAAASGAITLNKDEKAVLDHLAADWRKRFRTTSFGLAADVVGVRLPDESRLRLARFLEAARGSYSAPSRHGVTAVALSPQEKLMVRAMMLVESRERKAPTAEQIAAEMRVPAASLDRPLAFLLKLGTVSAEGEGPEPGYRPAVRFPRNPSPRIDFYSHQVEVNGTDKFEVA